MVYPNNFEIKVGFDKIRELLKKNCLSELGRNEVDSIQFSINSEKISVQLKQIEEFKQVLMFSDNFPVSYYIDTRSYFDNVDKIGSFFIEIELFDIKRSLDTVKSIINFFSNDLENKYPELRKLSKKVSFFPFVTQKINSVIDKYGKIKNNASPKLMSVRKELSSKQSSVSHSIHKILEKAKTSGTVKSDTEITVRDGKLLIPVPSAYKRKITGYVYDESATGQTSYIEPVEIIELNNAIKELEFAEKREIVRILTETTDEIRPYFPDLQKLYIFMGIIDFIRAKATLAIKLNAIMPKIHKVPVIKYKKAGHPLLILAYENTDKEVVKSDITLNRKQRIILISGPNAGGKSVALKTVSLLQYMFQCGLQIPVAHLSETGIFNKIFIDIGDEQSIENDLSTYSSHLVNMNFFTKNADEKTLLFIDEFGTGTEPLLGGAIAEAVLEKLSSTDAKAIITTHYTNLKQFADNNYGISNGAMLYDSEHMKPLYKLEVGRPGSSFAFEIAKRTGLLDSILKSAESKIDKTQIDFEKALKEVQKDKQIIAREKQKLRELNSNLENKIQKYEIELNEALNKKREILQEANRQAEKVLSEANKKIERTIYEIKKTNADKEKTKEIRAKLRDFEEQNAEKQRIEQERINNKIEKIRNKQKNRKKNKNPEIQTPEKVIITEIKIGDIVKMEAQKTMGEVLEIKGNNYKVAFGSMQISVKKNKLIAVSQSAKKQYQKSRKGAVKILSYDNEESARNFVFGLDVRGKRADEALQIVSRYIDDAIVERHTNLKILHGTGNGILRNIIRDFLRTHDLVKSYKDERIEAGGTGITLFSLDL